MAFITLVLRLICILNSTHPLTGLRVSSLAILLIASENARACKLSWPARRSMSSCLVPDAESVRLLHSPRRSCSVHGVYTVLWVGSMGEGDACEPVK
jgi:hypothetical protein